MEEGIIEKDMTPKLIGETYLKKATPNSPQRYRFGIHECQYCGREFEVRVYSVKIGNARSCGCLVGKKITHGFSYHNFYRIWVSMMDRCSSPKAKDYKNYGARGITVCAEWLDVANFISWAEITHPNIGNTSLDRIDNNKGYSPDNCRWADKITQNLNQRMKKNNTSGYTGVGWHKNVKKWLSSIRYQGVGVYIGQFDSIEEAVQARDTYITQNDLPHKLSTDYKREESL